MIWLNEERHKSLAQHFLIFVPFSFFFSLCSVSCFLPLINSTRLPCDVFFNPHLPSIAPGEAAGCGDTGLIDWSTEGGKKKDRTYFTKDQDAFPQSCWSSVRKTLGAFGLLRSRNDLTCSTDIAAFMKGGCRTGQSFVNKQELIMNPPVL